jgi:hypothetical protein
LKSILESLLEACNDSLEKLMEACNDSLEKSMEAFRINGKGKGHVDI